MFVSNLDMLCAFLTKLRNWSIKEEYNIGFVDNTYEDIISGKPLSVKWMAHSYKDSWFADPFILDVTDTQISFSRRFLLSNRAWTDLIVES